MELKSFKTEGGHTIEYNEYITGRDMRNLRNVFMTIGDVDMSGGSLTNINTENADKAENMQIELVVKSVDGVKEGIADLVLNLPMDDYNEILAKVHEITDFDKKK